MSRKTKAAEFVGEGLNLSITGRNITITDAMRQYIMERLAKLERYNIRIIDVAIVLDIQKVNQNVDIVVKVDHIIIKSHASTEDMYGSIEQAMTKLQTQIRRYHDRIRDHQNKPVSNIEINVNILKPAEQELLDINLDIDAENAQNLLDRYTMPRVVRQEKMALKMLTQDEAVMKLDLSGDEFLIYKAEEDRKLKMLHRREEGFALVELEA